MLIFAAGLALGSVAIVASPDYGATVQAALVDGRTELSTSLREEAAGR